MSAVAYYVRGSIREPRLNETPGAGPMKLQRKVTLVVISSAWPRAAPLQARPSTSLTVSRTKAPLLMLHIM